MRLFNIFLQLVQGPLIALWNIKTLFQLLVGSICVQKLRIASNTNHLCNTTGRTDLLNKKTKVMFKIIFTIRGP
jgi:hypothetical protein